MLKTPRRPSLSEVAAWAKRVAARKKTYVELPPSQLDRGLVTCGGSYRYFCNAWVLCRIIREQGFTHGIELWICSQDEWSQEAQRLCESINVTVRNAAELPIAKGRKKLSGWQLKSVALAYSHFSKILFLDADNVPTRNPAFLFESSQFLANGAVFWPDRGYFSEDNPVFKVLDIPYIKEREVESGQMLVNRDLNLPALAFAMWINLNSKFFYRLLYGDKDTFPLAFKVYGSRYQHIPHNIRDIGFEDGGVMLGHDFNGSVLFQHRHRYKWCAIAENPKIPGFQHEPQCVSYLRELKDARSSFCDPDFGRPTPGDQALTAQEYFINEIKETATYGDGWSGDDKNAHMAGYDLAITTDSAATKERMLLLNVVMPTEKLKKMVNKGPLDSSGRWQRISFEEDGTIGAGANDERLFYQVEEGRLTKLFGAGRRHVKFESRDYGYLGSHEGHNGGGASVITDLAGICSPIKYEVGEEVTICTPNDTLLEAVTIARCCLQMSSQKNCKVVYRTQWADWLEALTTDNFSAIRQKPAAGILFVDPRVNTAEMYSYGTSRYEWYCRVLGINASQPAHSYPVDQLDLDDFDCVVDLKDYLLILPEAEWPEESPAFSFWQRLIHERNAKGQEVIVAVSSKNFDRVRKGLGSNRAFMVNIRDSKTFLNLAISAKEIISADCGLGHLCATVGLSMSAYNVVFPGTFSWGSFERIKSQTAKAKCAGCRRSSRGGFELSCVSSCFAASQFNPQE